jgi:transcriptional regulator with XRE-family HTH domain
MFASRRQVLQKIARWGKTMAPWSAIVVSRPMDDHTSTLGELLRAARERLASRNGVRVRQADVAEHADITVEWYARIERGGVLPSFDVLSRIAAALCLSSNERIEALRSILPEQLRRDNLEHPVARAERGVLRVGAIDLPIVAPVMLRALAHVARGGGFSVRQTGHSWFEQAGLLEDNRLDVAIAYRFAGVDVPEQFGEFLVADEFSRAIATTSEWSARAGAVTRSDLFEGTLHGAAHRVGNDMLQTLKLQGFDYDRYRGLPSLLSVAGAMRGKDYAFVSESYETTVQDAGFLVRPVRDIGIASSAVLRWRIGDQNPALLRFLEALHG